MGRTLEGLLAVLKYQQHHALLPGRKKTTPKANIPLWIHDCYILRSVFVKRRPISLCGLGKRRVSWSQKGRPNTVSGDLTDEQ